ncbi:MAG TPA: phosphoribosylanthranilate isomerase [Pedobacter sp.]|jgi:phosphoribosylanthranilate isomerase
MKSQLKLKVCGMQNAENIRQLAVLNPDYIGFIFYSKSKRFVEEVDEGLLNALPNSIKKTGVFVDESFDVVVEKIERFKLNAVQLHGNETPEYCGELKKYDVEVIKAFGLYSIFDFSQLNSYKDAINYFLFDTQTEQHGGSGKTFNWNILSGYNLQISYFLSGGLSLEHLSEIKKINDSRLFALDLNSKFELEPGVKDIEKLRTFFNELNVPLQGQEYI